MKFSLPTNFDPSYIEGLKGYPVTEVYGKLLTDIIGAVARYEQADIWDSISPDHVSIA